MRYLVQQSYILFFVLFLAACSGGNKLSETTGGTDTGGTTPTSTVVLSMVDTDGNTVTNVDGSKPQWLSAIYLTDGKAVANTKVAFSLDADIGQLLVESALTNSDGIAKVEIHAGSKVGAGTATVTIGTLTDTLDFSTSNPVAVIEPVNLAIGLVDDAGTTIKNVSSIEPARVQATLTHSGLATAGVKVTFSLSGDVGELKTTSALTDDNGVASILLYAGAQDGAGTINAAVGDVTASLDFSASVAAVNVVMGDLTLTPIAIGPNGTASLSVPINEVINGVSNPLTQSVNVQFSSACVQAGKAEIAGEVATINGIATVTYKDKGCGSVDKINVTSTIGQTVFNKNIDLTVGAAALHSIQFTSVSSDFIALRGTGGLNRSETATVTFTVRDTLSKPVPNTLVNFSLTTEVGGIKILPETQSETDADGNVDVIVQSGIIATPVQILASLAENANISTISGQLSISSGVADYNSFSLSASNLNPETINTDGVDVSITARLADHFNNPVPDGTAVQFTTEFGAITPSCLTVNGVCSATWTSQSPRFPSPAFRDPNAIIRTIQNTPCLNSAGVDTLLHTINVPCPYSNKVPSTNRNGGLGNVYGNRISILAHVIGEESFVDSNGNGSFDVDEAYVDLSEAFRDENEDGVFGGRLGNGVVDEGALDAGMCQLINGINRCFEPGGDNEEYIDFNSNNKFDSSNNGDVKKYNGVLCKNEDICSSKLVSVYKNITILQTGAADTETLAAGFILTGAAKDIVGNYNQSVDLTTGPKTLDFVISDKYNGSLPSETTITFDAGNGEIVGSSECKLGLTSSFSHNLCRVSLKADDETSSAGLVATVKFPSGKVISYEITVND